jgi:hypothetical protein
VAARGVAQRAAGGRRRAERSHIQDSKSIEIPADCALLGWRLRKPQHCQDSLLWESSFSQTLNDRDSGAPTHEDDFVNVFDREICVLESLLDLSKGEERETLKMKIEKRVRERTHWYHQGANVI